MNRPRASSATFSSMRTVIFWLRPVWGLPVGVCVCGFAWVWLMTLCPARALRLGWGLVIGLSFCEFLHVFA